MYCNILMWDAFVTLSMSSLRSRDFLRSKILRCFRRIVGINDTSMLLTSERFQAHIWVDVGGASADLQQIKFMCRLQVFWGLLNDTTSKLHILNLVLTCLFGQILAQAHTVAQPCQGCMPVNSTKAPGPFFILGSCILRQYHPVQCRLVS